MDFLAKNYGGGYVAAVSALEDIREWITKDVEFENFLANDAKFREHQDGYTADGFDYAIKVPKSKKPESKYFIREERVKGKNLTKWEELVSDGHDMKQISSLILKNYINQIMSGRVHSDVHIGNFCVTHDKKIAIFDRNFYLNLTQQDQGIIFSLIDSSEGFHERSTRLKQYLGSESANWPDLANKEVDEMVLAMSKQKWNDVHGSLIKIKQMGVKIPLTLTLLLKNFNSLQVMARRAGFGDLMEAYSYQP
ncbi:hypothetical protein HY224_02715 [Candidatus Uhrbacteria bacterium]|nr:hypothetical protein [Candidatus Uhrbacteria bacterium]